MTASKRMILAIGVAASVAACGRLGLNDFGSSDPRYKPAGGGPRLAQGQLQALPPVPTQPSVAMSDLPPPPGTDPNAPPPGPAVAAGPAAAVPAGPPIGRTELLGRWKLASGSDQCQLDMTLTTWFGGYRAKSLGCASPQLQKISAWELAGRQIALKGADGTTVATLTGAGGERFQGQISDGQPVSITR